FINLAWTAPDGAATFNIYRGTSPGGESAVPFATGISATSFIDTKVVSGTTYYYTISAVDAGGESETSAEVAAAPAVNPAQGKPPPASSVENGGSAAVNAFDGSTRTRWSSQFADNQWIQVDLGGRYDISRVTLDWENAYARAYEIQVSTNGLQWNRI